MKFNMSLSNTDLHTQRRLLEELFTTQLDDGCCQIETKTAHLCMQVFEKTFADDISATSEEPSTEICPICKTGSLTTKHLRYYQKTLKCCNVCYYSFAK